MQTASQKYFKVKQVLNWANLLTTRKDVKEQMQPTPSSSSSHYSGLGWVGLGGTMAHYCITACSEECSFFFFTLLWHLLFSAPLMNSKNVWNQVSVRPLETITLPTQKISLESFCHGKHLVMLISNHILAQQQVGGWGLNVWICIIIWLEYITGFQLIREGQSFWCACLHSHLSPPPSLLFLLSFCSCDARWGLKRGKGKVRRGGSCCSGSVLAALPVS